MPFLEILCPNGHKVKVELSPNTQLLKALEEACQKKDFNPKLHELRHNRKSIDLSLQFRLSGLINHSKLEMVPISESTPGAITTNENVTVALKLENSNRKQVTVDPDCSLWKLLLTVVADDHTLRDVIFRSEADSYPTISYLGNDITGEVCLSNTTLRSMGLCSGRVLFQFSYRRLSSDQLLHMEQQLHGARETHKRDSPMEIECSGPSSSDVNYAAPSSSTGAAPKLKNSQGASQESGAPFNNPLSAFYEPSSQSIFLSEQEKRSQSQSKTPKSHSLGEMLGVDLDLGSQHPFRGNLGQSSEGFTDFKFPEETAGKDLYQNEQNEVSHNDFRPCDREDIVFTIETSVRKPPQNSMEVEEDLPEEFFELTEDDIKKILVGYRKSERELLDAPLLTQALRQQAKNALFEKYPRCIIQFHFPDRNILQSVFKPRETVQALYKHMRSSLNDSSCEFVLYTTPPKLILKDRTKSLIEADLVPLSKIYVSFPGSNDQERSGAYKLSNSLLSSAHPGNSNAAKKLIHHYMTCATSSQPQSGAVKQPAPSVSPGKTPPNKMPRWFQPGK